MHCEKNRRRVGFFTSARNKASCLEGLRTLFFCGDTTSGVAAEKSMVRFVGTKVRFARGSGGVSPSSSGINFSTILRSSAKDRTPNLCSAIASDMEAGFIPCASGPGKSVARVLKVGVSITEF